MEQLKKPSAHELEQILKRTLVHESEVLELGTIPRIFRYYTGVYVDSNDSLVGVLVLDLKLCCLMIGALERMGEAATLELLLTQHIDDTHRETMRRVFELLSPLFFLGGESGGFQSSLYKLYESSESLTPELKAFMADPPRHACYQVAVHELGEGTMIYISVDAVARGSEDE